MGKWGQFERSGIQFHYTLLGVGEFTVQHVDITLEVGISGSGIPSDQAMSTSRLEIMLAFRTIRRRERQAAYPNGASPGSDNLS